MIRGGGERNLLPSHPSLPSVLEVIYGASLSAPLLSQRRLDTTVVPKSFLAPLAVR